MFAIKYSDETKDEFSRLFALWQDPEYLEGFFETHKSDLQNGFWTCKTIEEAVFETFDYAQYFENQLLTLSNLDAREQVDVLSKIFTSLHNSQINIVPLHKSKARNTWLRLYALRVDRNAYIVTGGAIKLTQKMQDRPHTQQELVKIERCRNYLIGLGIVDKDGVIEEIES